MTGGPAVLSPEQKRAAEILLNHPISEDEAVSIKSLGPTTVIPSRLSPEERVEALRALEKRFANAKRPEAGRLRIVRDATALVRAHRAVALPGEKC